MFVKSKAPRVSINDDKSPDQESPLTEALLLESESNDKAHGKVINVQLEDTLDVITEEDTTYDMTSQN